LLAAAVSASAETIWLGSLDLTKVRQGWGQAQADKAVTGKPLSIAGERFDRGVGTHANSTFWIELAGGASRFQARVGVDDAAGNDKASVVFKIVGDGRRLWSSGVMRRGQPARAVDVDVRGVARLVLWVEDAGDGTDFDHADWAGARLLVSGAKPQAIDRPVPKEEFVILTPKPGPAPRLNNPLVYGCRPGNPFLYRIPTQGERPMKWSARGLPASLTLNPDTGIITGTAPARGEHRVTFTARNRHGAARREFKIIAGDTLALTPPMGWNHWYTHYDRITDALMREAADVMVSSGMADAGYQYVSIDDCWMNAEKHADPLRVGPARDAAGRILPNRHFPDMKALTAYIHARGLKAGIYTSPGPRTCAGFAGAWQHEADDARQFAEWGFDLLKYDWCSYGEIAAKDAAPELVKFKKPYALMGRLLREQPRDIVLNLCQYGMGEVWKWGAEVGGHSWRTAGDLGFELDRVFEIALRNAGHRDWQKPGAWNDPDYIQIGYIGDARTIGTPKPCPLTSGEQYAFMSLWSLMAAPLFFSGDMGRLDEFTLNVLCNPEVIAVNQDPLGRCARVVPLDEDTFAMVKDLHDGAKALGLFNKGEIPARVKVAWAQLGIAGSPRVRDLWRQKDLGRLDGFAGELPRRGSVLLRLATRR
jgi:alpha-galactosidase